MDVRRNPPRTIRRPRRPDSPVTFVPPRDSVSPDHEHVSVGMEAPIPAEVVTTGNSLPVPPLDSSSNQYADTATLELDSRSIAGLQEPPSPSNSSPQDIDWSNSVVRQIMELQGINPPAPTRIPAPIVDMQSQENQVGLNESNPGPGESPQFLPQLLPDQSSEEGTHPPGDNTVISVVFIGIQTPQGNHTTFCDQGLPTSDAPLSIGSILHKLIHSATPAGRAIQAIQSHSHDLLVGVSDIPIDISLDFMHYNNNFVELDTLANVISGIGGARGHPPTGIPESLERTDLLTRLRIDSKANVFVIYIYPKNFQTLALSGPATSSPAVHKPNTDATLTSPAYEYLESHFAEDRLLLQDWLSTSSYGTAYQHCLIERQVMKVCRYLGIPFGGRGLGNAQVQGFDGPLNINVYDVASWMGTIRPTFTTIRTQISQARDAHRILRQQEQIGLLTDKKLILFLQVLNAMLGERILPALDHSSGFQEGMWKEGELEALEYRISPFMLQVKEIVKSDK